MTGIRIAGTGRYVPPLTVDNNAFAAFLDTSDEWIRSRTGIVTRHISDGEPSWYGLAGCPAGTGGSRDRVRDRKSVV